MMALSHSIELTYHWKLRPSRFTLSHPNPEEVSDPQLSHIVGNVLVELQIPVRICCLVGPDPLPNIRLNGKNQFCCTFDMNIF